jgi:uncharacterized Ntn-hydrolase superfamily protein
MTFSIIAHCPHTGRLGLGIATFSIGAGGRCEGILAGVGICKTQAYTNRGNDPLAIELLAQGHGPAHVMQMLEHNDPDHAYRQIVIIDVLRSCTSIAVARAMGWPIPVRERGRGRATRSARATLPSATCWRGRR